MNTIIDLYWMVANTMTNTGLLMMILSTLFTILFVKVEWGRGNKSTAYTIIGAYVLGTLIYITDYTLFKVIISGALTGIFIYLAIKRKELWGNNSLYGHVLFLIIGASISGIDVMIFHASSSMGALGIFSAFAVFPPLLLPAKGNCPSKEKVQLFVLTFAVSLVFGTFFGQLGFLFLAGQLGIEVVETPYTLATLLTLTVATAVCISYWTVSQMSRSYAREVFNNHCSCPPQLDRLIAMLYAGKYRFPDLGHALVEALIDFDLERIFDGLDKNELDKGEELQPRIWNQIEAYFKDKHSSRKESYKKRFGEFLKAAKKQAENWPNEVSSPVTIVEG